MATTMTVDTAAVADIVARYPVNRGSLIPILQDVQDHYGYLPESVMDDLAERLGLSPNEVYGVATFYTQFRFEPPGEHTIHVCQGTACHVRGGAEILQEFEHRLGIEAGGSTPDGRFDLRRVACLGCCALAPVVSVDGHVFAGVTRAKAPGILAKYRANEEAPGS
ncbi:MAG TPA: NADH-quinone oxidoreductase subunit NuoE [Candidatus Hydrogenedentes bacterium]|nr:NADH-quinone oxidoreductase subunit NuoE [Candidatus Hydrogenedentota bacterium]